ncbi:MAG: heavy metal-binding domain-containing protein [Nitrospirae bacterium]|nr:heavy metal-binding domain-containing protein [Nitrospirota bacterium]
MQHYADLINIAIFIVLIAAGYFIGKMIESRHYRSILAREADLISLPVVNLRTLADDGREVDSVQLVTGHTVISTDYFKTFLYMFRKIFGGRVASFESLLDRAKREAILRMKEASRGANIILNLRIETSTINKQNPAWPVSVEAMAYGTAITFKPDLPKMSPVQEHQHPAHEPAPSDEGNYEETQTLETEHVEETRFMLLFYGEIAPDQDINQVKEKVVQVCKVSPQVCDKMFSGRKVILKKDVEYHTAVLHQEAFQRTGALCYVKPMDS